MGNKTLGYILITTAALFLISSRSWASSRPAPNRPDSFPNAPDAPAPPKSNDVQAWERWVNQVIALYGDVKELWEEGGPFHPDSFDPNDPAVQENLLPNYDNWA